MIEIFIIASAGKEDGLGHLYRSIALIENFFLIKADVKIIIDELSPTFPSALIDESDITLEYVDNFSIDSFESLLLNQKRKAWIFIDSYRIDEKAEFFLNERGCVVVISDFPNRFRHCRALIDPSPGRCESDYAGLVAKGTRVYTGMNNAWFRNEIKSVRVARSNRRDDDDIFLIIVNCGSTNNALFVKWACDLLLGIVDITPEEVRIMIFGSSKFFEAHGGNSLSLLMERVQCDFSPFGQSYIDALKTCRLVVGALGVSAVERLYANVPQIVTEIADNQSSNALALAKFESVLVKSINDSAVDFCVVKLLFGDGAAAVPSSQLPEFLADLFGDKGICCHSD